MCKNHNSRYLKNDKKLIKLFINLLIFYYIHLCFIFIKYNFNIYVYTHPYVYIYIYVNGCCRCTLLGPSIDWQIL